MVVEIRRPRIAMIGLDINGVRGLTTSIGASLPDGLEVRHCYFQNDRQYVDAHKNTASNNGYQAIFVNQDGIDVDPGFFMDELEKHHSKIPKILVHRGTQDKALIELYRQKSIYGDLDLRAQKSPNEQIDNLIAKMVSDRLLKIDSPIAVYGGGRVGSELVRKCIGLGHQINWFSNSLSNGTYELDHFDLPEEEVTRALSEALGWDEVEAESYAPKLKEACKIRRKVGYKDLMLLKGIPEQSVRTDFNDLEDLILSGSGFLVFADSQHEPLPKFRDRREIIPWLFNNSMPRFRQYIDVLTRLYNRGEEIPTTIIASNPPETLAYYAALRGIPTEKLLTASADEPRIRRFLFNETQDPYHTERNGTHIHLLGEHASPVVKLDLIYVGGEYFSGKRIDGLLKKHFKGRKFPREVREGLKLNMEENVMDLLRQFGPQVMEASERLGKSYEDTQEALAQAIDSTLRFQGSGNFGHFQSDLEGFQFGAPPRVNLSDFSVSEKRNSQITKVIRKYDIKPKLKRFATKTRKLATSAI